MDFNRRTDLAIEAKELYETSTAAQTALTGVVAEDAMDDGFAVHRVEILDEDGARQLAKDIGTYLTITTAPFTAREEDALRRGVAVVARSITQLLDGISPTAHVLVVGLGNRQITPDALGPLVWDSTLVTRHLVTSLPAHFGDFRPVSALSVGVLGTTGVESGEVVAGLVRDIQPAAVIVVDALAARSVARLCNTIQLSTAGISPGSGVGNHRTPLTAHSLGVPVIAIGVPTVVDGGTLAADLLDAPDRPDLGRDLFVTPRDIDRQVADFARLIALSIGSALHPDLSLDDLQLLLD